MLINVSYRIARELLTLPTLTRVHKAGLKQTIAAAHDFGCILLRPKQLNPDYLARISEASVERALPWLILQQWQLQGSRAQEGQPLAPYLSREDIRHMSAALHAGVFSRHREFGSILQAFEFGREINQFIDEGQELLLIYMIKFLFNCGSSEEDAIAAHPLRTLEGRTMQTIGLSEVSDFHPIVEEALALQVKLTRRFDRAVAGRVLPTAHPT
jgi:hypothetical protein